MGTTLPCTAAAFIAMLLTIAAATGDKLCTPEWSAIGEITGKHGFAEVLALGAHDDGDGTSLFVAGSFHFVDGLATNGIARWDGEWHSLGAGVGARAMATFDDGSGFGEALYVTGGFSVAGDVSANGVAKWAGSSGGWWPVGGGITNGANALAVYDDGNGEALYAGGGFKAAGALPTNNIAKWSGAIWKPVGAGTNGSIQDMHVFDDDPSDGNVPSLFVVGTFTEAGGKPAMRIARWDGQQWHDVGGGIDLGSSTSVNAITSVDGTLYVGGHVWIDGPPSPSGFVFKYNGPDASPGSEWTLLGFFNSWVHTLGQFTDPLTGETSLIVGGGFTSVDGVPLNRIGKWLGPAGDPAESWANLGEGVNGWVQTVLNFDFDDTRSGGGNEALYIGGRFTQAGGEPALRIARWGCPIPPPIPGDLNGDGSVGIADLLILLSNWGPCPPKGACLGDLTGDGKVGTADLLILISNWS